MKSLSKILLVLVVIGTIVIFRHPLENLLKYRSFSAPCEKPIVYSLGGFDEKFGLSEEDFLSAILEAEAIWEGPVEKELFTYGEDGTLVINLIHDYRQEATTKLQGLDTVLVEDQATYDELKATYDALQRDFKEAKAHYDVSVASFNERSDAYEEEVRFWNAKGGAPKDEYEELEEERDELEEELAVLKRLEEELEDYVAELNARAATLNRLAKTLNIKVEEYNETSTSRGEEFTEADYTVVSGKESINVYEFNSQKALVRVLAHELGHALGLEHVEDPEAIMYKLNTGKDLDLTPDDRAALAFRCEFE